jgi:hypothetical protein
MRCAHERRSEETRLRIEQKIADLMEKRGATMSGTDKTDSITIRARECTLHKTEEFRANQRSQRLRRNSKRATTAFSEGSHFLSPRRPSKARNLGSLRSGSAIGSVGK